MGCEGIAAVGSWHHRRYHEAEAVDEGCALGLSLAIMQVELVTLPGCAYCNQAKSWLQSHHVPFQESSHAQHPRLESFPALLIDGRRALVGFHPDKWGKAINEARGLPSGLPAMPPARRAASGQTGTGGAASELEIEHTGGSCGKRVTPGNVGTMMGVAALGAVVGTETTLPWMAALGAVVYVLGAKRYGCQVRAAGTGLMLGAVGAAVKHCVVEDRKDEAARAEAAARAAAANAARLPASTT